MIPEVRLFLENIYKDVLAVCIYMYIIYIYIYIYTHIYYVIYMLSFYLHSICLSLHPF